MELADKGGKSAWQGASRGNRGMVLVGSETCPGSSFVFITPERFGSQPVCRIKGIGGIGKGRIGIGGPVKREEARRNFAGRPE